MLKLLLITLVLAGLTTRLAGADRITGRPFATRAVVHASNGMAATSHPLATQVALDILKQGGNAVDAAIAANACLGLMEPTGCGVGGDLFAIVWDAEEGRLHGLNGSGRSPKELSLSALRERLEREGHERIPKYGVLPLSVPGAVDGWFTLHQRLGRLPMEAILAPAIEYAERGFPVSELIAHYWEISVRRLADQPGFLATFSREGRAPGEGEVWRNPALARTYRLLAEGGRDAFYEGEIAERIVSFVREHGGYLSLEDFRAHASTWVDPVSTSYRGHEVWQLPPNGQGIAVLQLLNILEGYDLRSWGPESAEYVHHFIEAKKLVFEDRAKFYADMSMAEVPVKGLISKEYAARRRALIDPTAARRRVAAGNPALEEGDTVYLTVADREGNMVSLIQSNYRGMGSGVCPTGLGFGLQDRGEMFTLEDGHRNIYAPGKRPFHTIIPGFVTKDGAPWFSFGVMGGATQPQAQVQVLVNIIDFGMNVQEAGDWSRILHERSSEPTGERMVDGGVVSLESGYSSEVIAELESRGHRFVQGKGGFGGYQGILRDPASGVYSGASESRKDGMAAGF
ncbi:MAG: gamma-glutamyltransferase [Planctomycetota bacterium]|jgi:gamma-glutamyltranspeptidase/glutathione hydrolase